MQEPRPEAAGYRGAGTTPAGLPGMMVLAKFVLVAAADFLLCALAATGRVNAWLAIVMHVTLIAGSAMPLLRRREVDGASHLIGLLLMLLAGPLGMIATLFLIALERPAPMPNGWLDDRYLQISGGVGADPAGQIHDAMLTGRALRPCGRSRRFLEIIKSGTLGEKQALLGLIGLRYHADYFPLLALALRASESGVRAQAAAVFVKLKEHYKSQLKQASDGHAAHTAGTASIPNSIDRARALLECAQSGFIDAAEANHARMAGKALCLQAIADGDASEATEILFCRLLAASGEHGQLASRLLASPRRPEFEPLLADSLMQLGRHRELRDLIKTKRASGRPPAWTMKTATALVS